MKDSQNHMMAYLTLIMGLFQFLMGAGTLEIDSPSNRQSRAERKELERKRKAWYKQADRITPEDSDQFVPEEPLIERTDSKDIGRVLGVNFSRTTNDYYAPFISHRNPDGSFDKTPIPKPATFDITEGYYVISAYYAGMPLKDLPGERVPLRLLSTGKWRFDLELMVDELEAAAQESPNWTLPNEQAERRSIESHFEDVQNAVEDLNKTIEEGQKVTNYVTLMLKSMSSPEEALNEYDSILAGVTSEDGDIRENAYAALASLADTYPDKIAEDVDVFFAGLNDKQSVVRRNALYGLINVAEIRPEVIVPRQNIVREQTTHESQEVSSSAIEILSLIGESESDTRKWIDRLETILREPDDDVILTAATRAASLLAESNPEIADRLREEIEGYLDYDDSDVREYACMYFRYMGKDSVEPKLQQRLEDSNPDVRRAAEEALHTEDK